MRWGDIKGGPAVHAYFLRDFRILRTNLIEKGSAVDRRRLVPYTLYIDPQLGRIGFERKTKLARRTKKCAWRECR